MKADHAGWRKAISEQHLMVIITFQCAEENKGLLNIMETIQIKLD